MIIYYGIVEEGTERTPKGNCVAEPLRYMGREEIGRKPEFCCKEMRESYEDHNFQAWCWEVKEPIMVLYSNYGGRPRNQIKYCPFCGEKIKVKANLKLKAVEVREMAVTQSWCEEIT